jgi:hypothetical protein
MWSSARPLVVTVGLSAFTKFRLAPGIFGGPILIVRQRLCTKNLRVPSLDFGYRGFCHRELDITVLDRNLLLSSTISMLKPSGIIMNA